MSTISTGRRSRYCILVLHLDVVVVHLGALVAWRMYLKYRNYHDTGGQRKRMCLVSVRGVENDPSLAQQSQKERCSFVVSSSTMLPLPDSTAHHQPPPASSRSNHTLTLPLVQGNHASQATISLNSTAYRGICLTPGAVSPAVLLAVPYAHPALLSAR